MSCVTKCIKYLINYSFSLCIYKFNTLQLSRFQFLYYYYCCITNSIINMVVVVVVVQQGGSSTFWSVCECARSTTFHTSSSYVLNILFVLYIYFAYRVMEASVWNVSSMSHRLRSGHDAQKIHFMWCEYTFLDFHGQICYKQLFYVYNHSSWYLE